MTWPSSYVGSGMEDAINFGATISAFASGLGATAAGARILFALSRHTPSSGCSAAPAPGREHPPARSRWS